MKSLLTVKFCDNYVSSRCAKRLFSLAGLDFDVCHFAGKVLKEIMYVQNWKSVVKNQNYCQNHHFLFTSAGRIRVLLETDWWAEPWNTGWAKVSLAKSKQISLNLIGHWIGCLTNEIQDGSNSFSVKSLRKPTVLSGTLIGCSNWSRD